MRSVNEDQVDAELRLHHVAHLERLQREGRFRERLDHLAGALEVVHVAALRLRRALRILPGRLGEGVVEQPPPLLLALSGSVSLHSAIFFSTWSSISFLTARSWPAAASIALGSVMAGVSRMWRARTSRRRKATFSESKSCLSLASVAWESQNLFQRRSAAISCAASASVSFISSNLLLKSGFCCFISARTTVLLLVDLLLGGGELRQLQDVLIDEGVFDEVVEDFLAGLFAFGGRHVFEGALDGRLGDRLTVDAGGDPVAGAAAGAAWPARPGPTGTYRTRAGDRPSKAAASAHPFPPCSGRGESDGLPRAGGL